VSLEALLSDPEVRETLKRIIEYEEKKEQEFKSNPIYSGLDTKPYWELMQVPAEWHIVRKLILAGIVERPAKKWYILKDREYAKKVLEEYETLQKMEIRGTREQVAEIPDDLFDVIVGYEDVKKLFLMSLKAEKPTHILLVGPPASAKTVFLLEIARLKGAFYLLGGSTTKVGLIDQLFALRPNYVLLDEIDKMNKEDYTALLSLMETGIVKEVKHGKTRETILPARVYAACNYEKNLPSELLSRFQYKLHFKPYTEEEFLEVSKRVLIQREAKEEELAEYISRKVASLSKDVRDSIGVARLANTKEDVDFLVEVKKRYRGGF